MAMITDKERQEILETLWTVEGDLLRPPTGGSLERRLERLRRVIPLAERALQSGGWEQAIERADELQRLIDQGLSIDGEFIPLVVGGGLVDRSAGIDEPTFLTVPDSYHTDAVIDAFHQARDGIPPPPGSAKVAKPVKIERNKEWWLKLIEGEPDCPISAGVPTDRDVLWNCQQLAALGIEKTSDTGPLADLFSAIHRAAAIALQSPAPPQNGAALSPPPETMKGGE